MTRTIPTPEERAAMEGVAQEIAQRIGLVLDPAGATFLLIVCQGDWSTYVANAEREPCVQLLRETAARLETGMDVPPGVRGDDYGPDVVRFTAELQPGVMPGTTTWVSVKANGQEVGILRLRPDHVKPFVDLIFHEQPVS